MSILPKYHLLLSVFSHAEALHCKSNYVGYILLPEN
jgi:hypothetical protein